MLVAIHLAVVPQSFKGKRSRVDRGVANDYGPCRVMAFWKKFFSDMSKKIFKCFVTFKIYITIGMLGH